MKHYLGISLILLTLAAICFFAIRSCEASVDHTIAGVRDAFAQVFRVQPQITVNQRVILAQTAPIAELAVVTKDELISIGVTQHLEVMAVQIPLTEKKLSVESTFRLKAGFDLSEPFSVTIDPVTHAVRATLPRAKILSVEQIGDLAYHGDDAMLNRITDEERAQVVNRLTSAARDTAQQSSLRDDAEKQVAQRLQELVHHNGQAIQIEWSTDPAPKGPAIP